MKRVLIAFLFAGCAHAPGRYVYGPPADLGACIRAVAAVAAAQAPCDRKGVTPPEAVKCSADALAAAAPCAPTILWTPGPSAP